MRNLLVTIRFNGKNFHGWQVQKNADTVQSEFQRALGLVLPDVNEIKGCSRTDSGVHANMYCISFKTESNIEADSLTRALNTKLCNDIVVLKCQEVDYDFHARYNVKYKEYIYVVYNGKIRNPFLNDYSYFYKYPLDAGLLNDAAQFFVGKFDYSAFCSSHSKKTDTIKDVKSFHVKRKGNLVIFSVTADGFLYNMVRIMVGTLIYVNEGKIKPEDISSIIKGKNRAKAGKTAPPQGLYLNKIIY